MTIQDLSESEARELVRSGFGQERHRVAAACCAPVFWFEPPPDDVSRILNYGTASLVHTGERRLGITAAHVVSGYLEARVAHPRLVVQVGQAAIPLHDRIIDRSDALDLCTFDISDPEAERIGRSFHQSPFPWPPKPPERDRGVFFAGYSSVAQESPDSRITWGTATGLMVADTVEWDRIMMPLDRAYWVPHPTLRLPSEDEDWGGVSGGPLFSLVHGDSIVGWRFSGIVVEYLPIRGAQILRAAPITPVRPDGTIQVPI